MMKKTALTILIFNCLHFSNAQNVGIGTITPQATLDVKGNQRIGGTSNYMTFDSSSAKIEWKNAYIYAPVSQALMKHSAAADGLFYNNIGGIGKIEYRNASGNPVFYTSFISGDGYFSNRLGIGDLTPQFPLSFSQSLGDKISLWSNSTNSYGFGIQGSQLQIHTDISAADILFGYGSSSAFNETMRIKGTGNAGIGTSNPLTKLHLSNGSSGSPTAIGPLAVEGNTNTYINLLSPNANETGILFGKADNSASGGIVYNNNSTLNGLQFRNNGNQTRMVIDNAGNVGIGTNTPQYPLDINGRMRLSGTNPNDPGIWLNNAGIDRAFVGLQNNFQIGFYGNAGIGWGLTMNTSTGAVAINGNTGNAGQLLQSNGSVAAPVWVNPVDPPSLKTQYYQTYINSVSLTNASSSLDINVPVTVYANSIITVSVTVNVSTANYGGCVNGELSISAEPLGGGGLFGSLGKFPTVCGSTKNTVTTGELPLLASNGTMKIFGTGTGIGAIVHFTKTNNGPDLTIGNTTPALIIVKVIPQ